MINTKERCNPPDTASSYFLICVLKKGNIYQDFLCLAGI